MTATTANRVVAPFAAAALAATAVVAPVAATAYSPSLPSISVTSAEIDLVADQVFNPSIPLINWSDLGFSPLTPIPQIFLSSLMSPESIPATISVLAPFITAIPALPLAWTVGGTDHTLYSVAESIPALGGIASGFNDIAQWTAGTLGEIPLIGQPILTAFQMLPLLTQWMVASVTNPLPSVYDTSDFWTGVYDFLTGGDDGVGSAGGSPFDLDLSAQLGGFDLSSIFAEFSTMFSGAFEGLASVFDGLVGGVGDFLSGIDFIPSDFDFGADDLASLVFAPFDAIGLSTMLGPLMGVGIPLAITAWLGSTIF